MTRWDMLFRHLIVSSSVAARIPQHLSIVEHNAQRGYWDVSRDTSVAVTPVDPTWLIGEDRAMVLPLTSSWSDHPLRNHQRRWISAKFLYGR